MTDAVGYELAGHASALLFMKSNFMGVNSQMISNIKDTLLVSLLMIASLSYVENAIAGPSVGPCTRAKILWVRIRPALAIATQC